MRSRFVAFAALIAVLMTLVVPFVALAAEEETGDEATTTSTFVEGEGPAVPIVVEEPEEEEQPWTARFLIPILVLTAILIIAPVTFVYFARIKNRYRVVGS
jgi:hypothetical protein